MTTTQPIFTSSTRSGALRSPRQMLNKIPEVTIYFWVIKILCTTVGETAADLLNTNLGLGLTNTSWVMAGLLVVTLVFQFRSDRYIPGVYWLAVVLISVVGTLISDNLTDNYGVSLETSTTVFAVLLAGAFAAWCAVERTLSIHTIVTRRRETFYWLAILFTFTLGTSAGDLTAESLELGFFVSILLFAGLIAAVTLAHFRFGLNAVLAFWCAYVLTRPLGASIGDFLSQPTENGGQGLGTILTSCIFLAAILTLVVYLTRTKRGSRDRPRARAGGPRPSGRPRAQTRSPWSSTPSRARACGQRHQGHPSNRAQLNTIALAQVRQRMAAPGRTLSSVLNLS